MKVKLKLFANLMDWLPPGTQGNEVVVEAADDACIGEVLERFRVPERLTHLVLVNGSFVAREARPSWRLKDGDHLAVWPPVAGG
jgi:molybdopterin converting factor small subunit